MRKLFFVFLTLSLKAEFLDPPYKNLQHPKVEDSVLESNDKSDTHRLIALQSPVKSQGSRGTCSIFSDTAMLESMLIIRRSFPTTVDLSEEWLEYLIVREKTEDGSNSWANFSALLNYGSPEEEYLPYIPMEWKDLTYPGAKERCGTLTDQKLKSCLLGHRNPDLLFASNETLNLAGGPLYDPEFSKARAQAASNKERFYQRNFTKNFNVFSARQAKKLLKEGIPLSLGLDFYYGSWNHRAGAAIGIDSDAEHWSKGIVFYPVKGSLDRANSHKDPAGHSILLVGYDDDVSITKKVKMSDGSIKDFTYKGVYYFKNSWGTTSFGKDFQLDGKAYPGYGMITQDYAHDFGGFYEFPLR